MKSEKGFAFSVDAMFAIIIVVLLATAYVNLYRVEKADVGVSKSLRQQAIDDALASFYKNASSSSTGILDASLHGYCTKKLGIDVDVPADNVLSSISVENYCKEAGG